MSRPAAVAFLLAAALLEAGGDALIRLGLRRAGISALALLAAGALLLFCYGYSVNAPPWEFGRLLGVYIVFFFVIGQLVSWLVFKQPPRPSVIAAGALMALAGGILVAFP